MSYKSLSFHPCQRPQLPSYSSANNGHHGRFCLELTIRRVRTKHKVRQQYPGGFRAPESSLVDHLVRKDQEMRGDGDAQGVGLLEVDDELRRLPGKTFLC